MVIVKTTLCPKTGVPIIPPEIAARVRAGEKISIQILAGSGFAYNALRWGVAGLAIDAGRIETKDNLNGGIYSPGGRSGPMPGDRRMGAALGMFQVGSKPDKPFKQPAGRWPANVLFDEEAAAQLDQQSGDLTSGMMQAGTPRNNRMGYGGAMPPNTADADTYGDSGGASRFFYTAKASCSERSANLCGRNTHPTVKPVDLSRYLAKLILPPERDTPRRLLVPFCGSGSEILGAMAAGWDEAVGIEVSEEYAAIARARIEESAPLFLRDTTEASA